tara:strand:+ start:350 stop:1552 length:1203 start_codon:yes stop_codon:yes gene_type:complete
MKVVFNNMMKSVSLKYLLFCLFFSFTLNADDYVWGEEFKEGDIISAATFNQIFNTIQKLNRTPIDADLTGSWVCDAVHSVSGNDTTGWSIKGFLLTLNGASLTMTASSASSSLDQSYTFSTSNPSPFARFETNAASSGTYVLFKDMLFMRGIISAETISKYQINLISDDRFILVPLSNQNNLTDLIMCDSATAVPATPTSVTTSTSSSIVTISWIDRSDNEIGFKIYRRVSSESVEKEIATGITTSPYLDNGLTEGQTAYYSVSAYNDYGESLKSKVVIGTLDETKPTINSVYPLNGAITSNKLQPINMYPVSWNFSESVVVKEGFYECINLTTNDECNSVINLPSGLTSSGWGSTIANSFGIYIDPGIGNIQITLKKDFIKDEANNNLLEDYIWSFNTQ